MVEVSGESAATLASGPRADWSRHLTSQGDRVAALAIRKPHLLRSAAALSFTAMGDARRIPWATDLVSPEAFSLVASPADLSSANLGCWSRGNVQALNLCGAPDHVLLRRSADVIEAWRSALSSS
jgi:hypothetical protein